MNVTIKVTERTISKAISKEINSIVNREVGKVIKKFYRQDFNSLKPHVEKYVRDAVIKTFESPEMVKFLMQEASEVARIKTASYIRNHPGAL